MIVLLISLVLANVCLVSSQQQLGLPDNNRIYSTNTDIGVNLIAQVNSSFQFPLVIKPNNRVSLWLLARQTIQSYKANDPNLVDSLPIYYPGMVRSSNLTSAFNCLPSEDNCQQIRIPTFDITQVGVYSFRFDSANFLTTTKFQFNVSALASSIRLDCFSSNSSCQYNPATNVISVLADQSVSISCGVDVVQNDDYPFSAQFKLMADTYEDCLGQNSTLARFSSSIPNISNYNLLYSRLNKTCLTKFSIQDSNKKYSCLLNPTPVSSTETASYQPTQTYQTFSATLDVQYGPDPTLPLNPIPKSYEYLFNKTIMVGTQTNFTCPFNGNPTPNYYWRIVSSSVSGSASANDSLSKSTDFSLSSQDYTISRNLQVGSYVFECKAQVGGLVNNYSQTIQFSLTIIPPPTPVVKKIGIINPETRYMQNDDATNVGAIVGGVIGGVALLILIIVVVSLFVLYGRKRNSKDEIEKAKELDIDITDNTGNPHLTKNASVYQSQQKKAPLGLGNKVIAGLMVPNSTAQSYAAIAHAAAAAAQSNQQRNNYMTNTQGNEPNNFNSGSSNNLLINNANNNSNNNNLKAQSYNNPGFFESIPNPLESPPPYESALHQPMSLKKESPIEQQRLNQQQKDYMGSQNRLISEQNTPTQQKHAISQSYTATPQHVANAASTTNSITNTPNHVNSTLQQLGYQNQSNIQYTSVHNLGARSRNPLNGLPNDMDSQTQYSTIAAQLSSNPIDV